MIVLVTGGAGFIGSNLVDRLIDRGDEVRVLDNFSTGYRENLAENAIVFEGDLTDGELLLRAMTGAEVVFHEAAARSVVGSVEHPIATNRVNTHGTLMVLKAALDAGVRRVISASSSSIYGGIGALPSAEPSSATPKSPYAVSKLAGEQYCRIYWELHGLETVALRYFNVYGPRQRPDSAYASVIPLFIGALAMGERPVIYGDGRQSRDFTFVEDVVDANLIAADADANNVAGQVINVGRGESHSLLELLEILERIMNKHQLPHHLAPRLGDVRTSQADTTAARRILGFDARESFENGLKRTVSWFYSSDNSRPSTFTSTATTND